LGEKTARGGGVATPKKEEQKREGICDVRFD